jgi:putative flippase GtrA
MKPAAMTPGPAEVDRPWPLLLRFGLVGVMNTAFGYAVFAGLMLSGVGWAGALVGSAVAGVAFNFMTSRRLVFRTDGQLARFIALYAGLLTLNWLALRLASGIGLPDLAAQAILAMPIAGRFVFSPAVRG